MNGTTVNITSPSEAKSRKIAYVPPDRHRQGIIKPMSIRQNLSLPVLSQLSKGIVLDQARILELSREYMEKLRIKAPNDGQSVDFLSGATSRRLSLANGLRPSRKF